MILLIITGYQTAAATQPIMITISDKMNKVIFDGKWSFLTEWKPTTLTELSYNDTLIELRTAHQGDFIYVMVDAINLVGTPGADKALICLDSKDDKSSILDKNDYCFGVPFKDNNGFILEGGSPLQSTGHFVQIPNTDGFVGVSNISDENDRYTPFPHPSYEFKIPTNLVGRSDKYGFYLGVYDSQAKKIYTFPEDLTTSYNSGIPSPSKWGEIISPDKTLPEFPIPYIIFLAAFVTMMVLTRSTLLRITRYH